MDKKALLGRLNWFYTLESEQTKYYLAKAEQSEDPYIERVLRQISDVEAGHVKNISDWIIRFEGEPTHLGEELGIFFGTIAAGVSRLSGIDNMFAVSILLERKAMSDYRDLIRQIDHWELAQTLWANLIEEDLHTAWFQVRRELFSASVKQEKDASSATGGGSSSGMQADSSSDAGEQNSADANSQ